MRFSIFWVMFLSLLRDRGALISSFVMPATVFIIFAVIFSGTTGGSISVKVSIFDELNTIQSKRFTNVLFQQDGIRRISQPSATQETVRRLVAQGIADVGILIRQGEEAADPPRFQIIADPSREISVLIFEGALRSAYGRAFPEFNLETIARTIERDIFPFSREQKIRLDQTLETMRNSETVETDSGSGSQEPQLQRVNVVGDPDVQTGITYYAGAVAILFLLFSSVNGAMSLLEEKELGLLDRLATGPGGTRIIVDGKMLFLVIQGFIQVTIIFLVAWLAFDIDLPGNLGAWSLITLVCSFSASGLALAFTLLCSTKQQAQTTANIVILVISAIGGSMVPRFLMPEWIQTLGWLTPNTWALEAYGAIFWRGDTIDAIALPCAMLFAVGIAGLLCAYSLAGQTRIKSG